MIKTVTTFLFLALFSNCGVEKRRICRSLFSYDLLTTNYSWCVDMEVGRNDYTYLPILRSLLASNSWHFNALRLLVALWPGLTQHMSVIAYSAGVWPRLDDVSAALSCSAVVKRRNSQIRCSNTLRACLDHLAK